MYPHSGFRSGGTSAKTTLLETTLLSTPEKGHFLLFGAGREEKPVNVKKFSGTPRGRVPFVPWKCPVCPGDIQPNLCGIAHKSGRDSPPNCPRDTSQGIPTTKLSGPVLRDTARLSQRYPPIARYGVFGVSTWPIRCDTPLPLF